MWMDRARWQAQWAREEEKERDQRRNLHEAVRMVPASELRTVWPERVLVSGQPRGRRHV